MAEKCEHGIRDLETNLPYCQLCDTMKVKIFNPKRGKIMQVAYGIMNCGTLIYPSIRSTKQLAEFEFAKSEHTTWEHLQASGMFRSVKVRIHYER